MTEAGLLKHARPEARAAAAVIGLGVNIHHVLLRPQENTYSLNINRKTLYIMQVRRKCIARSHHAAPHCTVCLPHRH